MAPAIDSLRAVPEMAVRLLCGASVKKSGESVVVSFQGEAFECPLTVFNYACQIAKILSIDPSPVQTMNDVLRLRHRAEDHFVQMFTLGDKKLPKVLFLPAGEIASAFYRARLPADILTDQGRHVAHFTERIDAMKVLYYEVLWVQLACAPMLQSMVGRVKEAGVKIIYDVDDRFDVIPDENPAAKIYVEQKLQSVWSMIKMADAVSVSTEPLAAHIRKFHPNVHVIPNEVTAAIHPTRERKPKDFVRILWAGSYTHKRDLRVMAPGLKKVLERHAGKVRFTCFGDVPPEALHGVEQYVDRLPFVGFVDYAEALAGVDADIAVAPLEASEFNASKSAVKYLEYSGCKYPSLLSPVGEYTGLPKGAPLIHVNDGEWEKALEYAIGSPSEMAALGDRANEWVSSNRCIIKSGARKWGELVDGILSNSKKATEVIS